MRIDELTDNSGREIMKAVPIKRKIMKKMKKYILQRGEHVYGTTEWNNAHEKVLKLKKEYKGLTEPFIEDKASKKSKSDK